MQKLSNASKIIISAAAAVVIIILAIIYGSGQSQNVATNTNPGTNPDNAALSATAPTETTTTQTPTSTLTNGTSKSAGTAPKQPTAPASPAAPTIHLITPVANDIWTIGIQNLISWDKAPNISGSISLIDATTKQSVGVILPQIGPNQTSYSWNTRDIQLDRTNPLKKNVLPGTYMIVVAFDGNNLRPITSPSFTITN